MVSGPGDKLKEYIIPITKEKKTMNHYQTILGKSSASIRELTNSLTV